MNWKSTPILIAWLSLAICGVCSHADARSDASTADGDTSDQAPALRGLKRASDEEELALALGLFAREDPDAIYKEEVRVTFGIKIPANWAGFPHVAAAPLAVGSSVLSLTFRPYTALTTCVLILGPATVSFPTSCESFSLQPPTGDPLCSSGSPTTAAVELVDKVFLANITYNVQLGLLPFQTQWSSTPAPPGTWQINFLRSDGLQLAYAEGVPGYPVWPSHLDFERLEFPAQPPGSMIPQSYQVLAITFRVLSSFGRPGAGVVLGLRAPMGFKFPCSFVETDNVYTLRHRRLNLSAPLRVASTACPASEPLLQMVLAPLPTGNSTLLTAGGRYAFDTGAVAAAVRRTTSSPAEVADRTWYLTVSEDLESFIEPNVSEEVSDEGDSNDTDTDVEPPEPWNLTHAGGAYITQYSTRQIDFLLAVQSTVAGDAALLWVLMVPHTLVSSLSTDHHGLASVVLHVPVALGFACPPSCTVLSGPPEHASLAKALPEGSKCESQSMDIMRITIPRGSQLMPDVPYVFLLEAVQLPANISQAASLRSLRDEGSSCRWPGDGPGCSLEASHGWGEELAFEPHEWAAATVDADKVLVERSRPLSSQEGGLLSPLEEFAFSPAFSSPAARRYAAEYFAAFTFLAPATLLRLVGFLHVTAPPGYHFLPHVDCSPDSVAPLLKATKPDLTPVPAPMRLVIGWCRASPQIFAQWLSHSDGLLDEYLPKPGLRSALLALPIPLADWTHPRLFRVRVQHPSQKPAAGNTWSLSLLDSEVQPVAQSTRLEGYPLVGSLAASLWPLTRLPSQPNMSQPNMVSVSFVLSSPLPPKGSLGLQLGEAFRFPEHAGGETDCNLALDRPPGFPFVDTARLPPLQKIECSNVDRTVRITTGEVAMEVNTNYTFWVSVVNPVRQLRRQSWGMWTYGPSGDELDVNLDIPNFFLIEGSMPLQLASTLPKDVLAGSNVTAFFSFVLPFGLVAGAQLRLIAPPTFILTLESACNGSKAAPEVLAPSAGSNKTVWPLPPGAKCTVLSSSDGNIVQISLPDMMRGNQPYLLAVNVVCPSSAPVKEENVWHLQVWRQAPLMHLWSLVGSCPGLYLLPLLQGARVLPQRSQADAFTWQQGNLPETASAVGLLVNFDLPFAPGQLQTSLLVAVETPEAFQVGLAEENRSCLPRELSLGSHSFPADKWASCRVQSKNLVHLTVHIPSLLATSLHNLLPVSIDFFPLLPPKAASYQKLIWNLWVSTCANQSNCSLVAAVADLPTWDLFGYLHVGNVVVRHAHSSALPDWVVPHSDWARGRLALVTFEGVRFSEQLRRGDSLYVNAPCGYEFPQLQNASELVAVATLQAGDLPPLDFNYSIMEDTSCDVVGQILVLRFQQDLDVWKQYQFELAVRAPDLRVLMSSAADGGRAPRQWRLSTHSGTGETLDKQHSAGHWDYTLPFDFVFSAFATVAPPGDYFSVGIFLRMPDVGLSVPANYATNASVSAPPHNARATLQLLASSNFEFAPCDGRTGDNDRLRTLPSLAMVSDPRVRLTLLRPLPENSACASHGSTLTINLGGRRRGSGRTGLRAREAYAFAWPVRIVVGRQTPRRNQPVPGVAGEGISDLLVADEAASAASAIDLAASWLLVARVGRRHFFSSSLKPPRGLSISRAEVTPSQHLAKDLAPVWLFASTPYYGQSSILFVVFSLRERAYPPGSRLRLSLHGLAEGSASDIEFMPCREQEALHHRQAYSDPLKYFTHSMDYWSRREDDIALEVGRPTDMRLVDGETGSCSVEAWAPSRGKTPGHAAMQRLTFRLDLALAPPMQQCLVLAAVQHAPYSDDGKDNQHVLSLEILDGDTDRALARTLDLAMYPVTREMTLLSFVYSSAHAAALNQLTVEFQPATELLSSRENPTILGFALVAPPSFRFPDASCQELRVVRTATVLGEDGVNSTSTLFFNAEQKVECQVATSPWLSGSDNHQHQLMAFLPYLVELSPVVHYRISVPIWNPPHAFRQEFPPDAAPSRSPKFSNSPFLVPLLGLWRAFTFKWPAGDAGGHSAPEAIGGFSIDRIGGLRKADEVAWPGFEVLA